MTLYDVLHRQEFLEAYTVSVCTASGRHDLHITDQSLRQPIVSIDWDNQCKHLDIYTV